MAMADPYGLDNHAVRKALEFVAAHRSDIAKAQEVAASSASRTVIKEAERQRAQIIRTLELASEKAARSAIDATTRRRANEVAYLRRAVEPLSADKLAGQMAAMLNSDNSIGAKMVAMEVMREQADLQRARDEGLDSSIAAARQLVDEARATLSTVGVSPEDLGWTLPEIDQVKNESPDERQEEPVPAGVEELIRAIREDGAETRRTIQETAQPGWLEYTTLVLMVAVLLVSLAGLYLQASQSSSSGTEPTEHFVTPEPKPFPLPSIAPGQKPSR
jgi:hypothetical protein